MTDRRAPSALPPVTAAPRGSVRGLLDCGSKEVILPCRSLTKAPARPCNRGTRRWSRRRRRRAHQYCGTRSENAGAPSVSYGSLGVSRAMGVSPFTSASSKFHPPTSS